MALLEIDDLRVGYAAKGRTFYAVDGVSFEIAKNETVGLVGESGCGKSTLGKAVVRLLKPQAGEIRLKGRDIAGLEEKALRPIRRQTQMVFQDPYASLNPRQTVLQTLETPLKVHGLKDAAARKRKVAEIADSIGFPMAALKRYPHEFSGGQRQRIGIARALILEPELVVCDEPVSALDLSIQAQILNLLVDLKGRFGLSFLFISHDLSVVRYISDRVIVMYLGKIVETADHATLWRTPRHPYTKALLASAPTTDPDRRIEARISGEIGNAPETGCRFRSRCPLAEARCAAETPALRPLPDGAAVACHLV